MPHFSFSVHDGAEQRSLGGRHLGGIEAVQHEAGKIAASIAAAELPENVDFTSILKVRDEAGNIVFTLRLVCQVELR